MEIPAEWLTPGRKATFPFILQHGKCSFDSASPKIFGEFVGNLIEKAGVIVADKQEIDRSKGVDVSGAYVLTL